MNTLRYLALASFMPCVYAATAESPSPAADPAESLIREAALHSPVMLEQELRIAQADAFRFRGWRQYMPYITANYQGGYFNLLSAADPNAKTGEGKFGGSYTLSAAYPLYAWGGIEAEKKFTFARENLARSDALISWRALAGEIRGKFLEAVVNKARVNLLEKRALWARERIESSKQELALGRIVESELTSRTLDQRNAELLLTQRKIELASQLSRLRAQTGATTFGVDALPDDIPSLDWDDAQLAARLADFTKIGEDDAPETRSARYADEVYATQMTMAESREKPQFNLGASVTQSPVQTPTGFGMQTYLFAGLMGTWNIFDRDTTRESVRSFAVARRLVEAKRQSGSQQRRTELANALQQIAALREALTLRTDILKLRQGAYDDAKHRLDLGLIKREDVNATEDALLDARLSRLNDLAQVQNAYHTFMSGILLAPTDTLYIAPTNDR